MAQGNLKKINYSIGLDIGTNSVGWAVVDENMNLVKRCKKHLWGVRLFDERQTAKTRRSMRTVRRRLLRRRVRLMMLNNIFAPLVSDENFFVRLHESFLQKNDRTLGNVNILFDQDSNCVNFIFNEATGQIEREKFCCDAEFYQKYPTIYHLRREMVISPQKQYDPKLIYLAVHHILKSRGNFINENL